MRACTIIIRNHASRKLQKCQKVNQRHVGDQMHTLESRQPSLGLRTTRDRRVQTWIGREAGIRHPCLVRLPMHLGVELDDTKPANA